MVAGLIGDTMASVTRDLVITYGTLTVGGSSQFYLPSSYFEKVVNYPVGSFAFDVVVRGSTHAELKSKCDDLEAAYRKPRQDLTVTINSQSVLSWSHSSNTGMNARPSVTKAGSEADSALSRLYRCQVEVDLPADLSGVAGRQSSQVRVSEDASGIKAVDIEATYTALGGSSATTQMLAQIATYASAVQTAIGITAWERVSRDYRYDDQDKTVTVNDQYREIVRAQPNANLDNSAIVNPTLTVSRRLSQPGNYRASQSNVRPLTEVTSSFSCSVRADVTLDLDDLWANTVKSWMIDATLDAFDGNAKASLDSQTPLREEFGNTLSASLTFMVVDGGDLIRQEWSYTINTQTGRRVVPVWDGHPLAAEEIQGPAVIIETQSLTRVVVATSSSGGIAPLTPGVNSGISSGLFSSFLAGDVQAGSGGGGTFQTTLIDYSQTTTPRTMGQDGYELDVNEVVTTQTIQYRRPPATGAFIVGSVSKPPGIPAKVKLPGETALDRTMPLPQ